MNTSEIQEAINLIEKLNNEYYEKTQDEDFLPFSFKTNGFECCIKFLDFYIWNSVDDERDRNDEEEYEPFENFIRRNSNNFLKKIKGFQL